MVLEFWVFEFREIEFSMVLEFMELEYHKKFPENLKYIFFLKNSSFKKVVDSNIFPKQW